ncbi:hypothetical protein HGI30_16750 [Paenibacillus albicereus]|uniref:Phage head-tail connector protein n=1 Tax=Paenibacillus albicereus TaxID=2726185 RepID=A0A6H2H0D4_9BACL|nr:phage head-tail connector protein [Paenibacillus albicereus]QJC53059.1 hypothetical protein HGI30_16750 [Paenibacillus albicereus]
MTQDTIDKLLLVLPGASSPLLSMMAEDAELDLLSWTSRTALPPALESTLRQLVVMRYNKMGIEGQTAHSEGGVSRAFADLPSDLQQTVGRWRRVRVAGS